jgi:anti-sigma regulatory factor (Ser/Thr protein kinase)
MPSAQLSETLPAVPESVPHLRRAVTGFAAAAGATTSTLDGVRLAVTEAVSNAIVHAYIDEERPGFVRVTAAVRADALHVTVRDHGRGMLPRVHSPGLGLGIPLIGQAADAFDVHEVPGGGAEIRMSFRLHGEAEAAFR